MKNLFVHTEKDLGLFQMIISSVPDYRLIEVFPQPGRESLFVRILPHTARIIKSEVFQHDRIENVLDLVGDVWIYDEKKVFRATCCETIPFTGNRALPPPRKWTIEIY